LGKPDKFKPPTRRNPSFILAKISRENFFGAGSFAGFPVTIPPSAASRGTFNVLRALFQLRAACAKFVSVSAVARDFALFFAPYLEGVTVCISL
jgi:hypothetical protein